MERSKRCYTLAVRPLLTAASPARERPEVVVSSRLCDRENQQPKLRNSPLRRIMRKEGHYATC